MSEYYLRHDPYNFDTQEDFEQFDYESNCSEIIKHHGFRNQQLKLVEECAELIRAIIRNDNENFKEEVADVLVLIDQFKQNDSGFEFKVNEIKQEKVEREIGRIKHNEQTK